MTIDRKALNNQRNRTREKLKSERETARKRRQAYARDMLSRTYNVASYKDKQSLGLLTTTAQLSNAVLKAFEVNVPLQVGEAYQGPNVTAYTDFTNIYVYVKSNLVNLNDLDSVAEYIYMVKGAVYHEGGHVKYSRPWIAIRSMTFGQLMQQIPVEWQALADRIVNPPDPMVINGSSMQRAWNILEDQRMETAMVKESPVLARYFTSIVLNVVVNTNDVGGSWPYMHGRKYLPDNIRQGARDLAVKDNVRASLIHDIERVIDKYVHTNDVWVMVECVTEMAELLHKWNPPQIDSGHQNHRYFSAASPKPVPETDENEKSLVSPEDFKIDPDQEPEKNDGQGQGQEASDGQPSQPGLPSPGDEQGDDQGQGSPGKDQPDGGEDGQDVPGTSKGQQGDESLPQNPTVPGTGAGTEGGGDPLSIKRLLDALHKDAVSQHINEAKRFLSNINEEAKQDLPRDPTATDMEPELKKNSDSITSGIMGALEHLVDHTAPTWRFRQENGVLDPTAFAMREPGETDYWSGMDEYGAQGYDLAVSVIIDTSYSMVNLMEDVSSIGLAIRQACDNLEIPCSVSTFNTAIGALYRADEPTVPRQVQATGGTTPAPIFEYLDSQRMDKKRHLVVILTDGEWAECDSLDKWGTQGRYFLLVGIGVAEATLRNKQPDAYIVISYINELVTHFNRAMAGFLA